MANGLTIQNLISFVSILVSSGAIGYIIRLVIRIEVLERLFNEKKSDMDDIMKEQNIQHTRLSLVEQTADRIESSLSTIASCIKSIPEMTATLNTIQTALGHFVPRNEIELMVRHSKKTIDNS